MKTADNTKPATGRLESLKSLMTLKREQLLRSIEHIMSLNKVDDNLLAKIIDRRKSDSSNAANESRMNLLESRCIQLEKDVEPKLLELELLRKRVHRAEKAAEEAEKNATRAVEEASMNGKTETNNGEYLVHDKKIINLEEDIQRLERLLESSTEECSKLAQEKRVAERLSTTNLQHGPPVPRAALEESEYRRVAAEKEVSKLVHICDGLRRARTDFARADNENAILRGEMETLRSQYDTLGKECRHCHEQVEQISQERDHARILMNTEQDKRQRQESSTLVKELRNMNGTLKKENIALKTQLKRTDEIRMQADTAQIEAMKYRQEADKICKSGSAIANERIAQLELRLKEAEATKEEHCVELLQLRGVSKMIESKGLLTEEEKFQMEECDNIENAKLTKVLDEVSRDRDDVKQILAERASFIESLEAAIKTMKEQLSSKEEEISAFAQEMEEVAGAYEDMRMQNERLLEKINEKDDGNTSLVTEKVRAELACERALHKVSLFEQRIVTLEESLEAEKNLVASNESRRKEILLKMEKVGDEHRRCESEIDILRKQKAELEGQVLVLDTEVQTAKRKESAAIAHEAEAIGDLNKERKKRQRVEGDLNALRNRSGLALDNPDDTELQLYKRMVQCNVCNKHHKDVIITKCYHMFCKSCIETNLESRQRKCPTCGLSFGYNDVKQIYV